MQQYEGSFITRDENGEKHIIDIYVSIINVGSEDTLKGLKSLITKSGEHVNYIRKGKYEIVRTDTLLFSDDPEAP